jgi:hypothetical protein
LKQFILPLVSKFSQGILIPFFSHDDATTIKENIAMKTNIIMKATTIEKMALEAIVHATRVVALVHVELRKTKIANA